MIGFVDIIVVKSIMVLFQIKLMAFQIVTGCGKKLFTKLENSSLKNVCSSLDSIHN